MTNHWKKHLVQVELVSKKEEIQKVSLERKLLTYYICNIILYFIFLESLTWSPKMKQIIEKIFCNELKYSQPIKQRKVELAAREIQALNPEGIVTSQKIRTFISNTYRKNK